MQNQSLHAYPRFSRKTRIGIISLLIIILLLTFLPFLFPVLYKPDATHYRKLENELKLLEPKKTGITEKNTRKNKTTSIESAKSGNTSLPMKLFYFDPNQLSEQGWLQLGVKEKTANTIRNYLSKGGRFRTAEDIRKIWGMPANIADQLIPFVRISPPADYSSRTEGQSTTAATTMRKPVDINKADTTAWMALPGIGSKLANRIVAFREKLGGFYRLEQVQETFGLKDSVFQQILPRLTLAPPSLRQLNINTASLDELKSHPYIRYPLANAIVQYRQQHGAYQSPDELRKLVMMDEASLQKMIPYLRTDQHKN